MYCLARAKGSDSAGGVMDRIVSQLLTEMDNLAKKTSSEINTDNEMVVSNGSTFLTSQESVENGASSFQSPAIYSIHEYSDFSQSWMSASVSKSDTKDGNYSKEILYDDIYSDQENRELSSVAIFLDNAIVANKEGMLTPPELIRGSPWQSPSAEEGEHEGALQEIAEQIERKKATADKGMVFLIAATNRPDLLDQGSNFSS